jgi:hypothetical protein
VVVGGSQVTVEPLLDDGCALADPTTSGPLIATGTATIAAAAPAPRTAAIRLPLAAWRDVSLEIIEFATPRVHGLAAGELQCKTYAGEAQNESGISLIFAAVDSMSVC